jgi:hypothetical protein
MTIGSQDIVNKKTIKRIPSKNIAKTSKVVLKTTDPDLLWLRPDEAILKNDSGYIYSKQVSRPYPGDGSGGDNPPGDNEDKDPEGSTDTVDLSDIESITFEEYYDAAAKTTKYNALIKIKNTSQYASTTVGVDARIYNAATSSYAAAVSSSEANPSNSSNFITPTPSVPSVIFDRTGSTGLSWGWNDSSGLGSYDSISYEWIIKTLKNGGTTVSSGSKAYPSPSSYGIGDSGKNRQYKVSSSGGDTPASSSARWLSVRAVVTGTNNKKYYSSYSTPI